MHVGAQEGDRGYVCVRVCGAIARAFVCVKMKLCVIFMSHSLKLKPCLYIYIRTAPHTLTTHKGGLMQKHAQRKGQFFFLLSGPHPNSLAEMHTSTILQIAKLKETCVQVCVLVFSNN